MKTLSAIICSLAIAPFAVADISAQPDSETVEHYKKIFEQLDSDDDAKLSQEEAAAAGLSADNFRQLDEDENGELNREEFIVIANDPAALKGYDADAPYGSDAERDAADDIEADGERAQDQGQ